MRVAEATRRGVTTKENILKERRFNKAQTLGGGFQPGQRDAKIRRASSLVLTHHSEVEMAGIRSVGQRFRRAR